MWKKAKAALLARVAAGKRWMLANRRRSRQLGNLLVLVLLALAYAVRARSERRRWDQRRGS
jgi:hypothetical protein